MERPKTTADIQGAYNILLSLYRQATQGGIPEPGCFLSGVREHPEGGKFKISQLKGGLLIHIYERDGSSKHISLDPNGLSSVSLVEPEGGVFSFKEDKIKEGQSHLFKGLIVDLAPWVTGRYLGGNETNFPESVSKILQETVAS